MPPNPKLTYGRNRTAAEETIAALEKGELVKSIDSARITALRALADAVDADPSNASLWREYRAAETALRGAHDNDGDEAAAFVRSVSAKMGNSTNARKGNSRSRGSGSS